MRALTTPGIAPRAPCPRAEVVDEDIDGPELGLGFLDRSLAAVFGQDVGGDAESIYLIGHAFDIGFGSGHD